MQCIHYSELCLFYATAIQLDFLPDRSWFHLINSLNSVNTYNNKTCKILPHAPITPSSRNFNENAKPKILVIRKRFED